MIVLYWYLSL